MTPLDLTLVPKTDPLEIYRYRDGMYAVDLLTAAVVHLNFFTWLAKDPSDASSICAHFGTTARPTDVMLTLFAANGLIASRGGIFHITDWAKNISPTTPRESGRPCLAEGSPREGFPRRAQDRQASQLGSARDALDWHKAMETEAFAILFTAAMDRRGLYLGRRSRRLDLRDARGCSILARLGIMCSLVAHHPHLCAAVFDQRPAQNRCSSLPSAASPTASGGGGRQLKDPLPAIVTFIFTQRAARLGRFECGICSPPLQRAQPSGLLIIHDAFINADKTGPLPVAAYWPC
jgi:hypothetical protein